MEQGLIPHISVVVPVFNEEGSAAPLHAEIRAALEALGRPHEIIFVDDGSGDGTAEVLGALTPLTLIRLRRNFGQTAALDAGIKQARGTYVVTMDGDGQNDPADIAKLLQAIEGSQYDLISGWRKHRQDSVSKKLSSRAAALLRKVLLNDGIHDSGCTLKIYKRECFEDVDLTGEMHRFIPAILAIKGFKVGEMVVHHRARTQGKTKYTWSRGVKGILDMFAVVFWRKYANRPLHLFGGMGVLIMGVSGLAGLVALYEKFAFNQDLSNTFLSTLSVLGFLTGIQFFVFGLLADMLSKNYFAATGTRAYTIKEILHR